MAFKVRVQLLAHVGLVLDPECSLEVEEDPAGERISFLR